MNSQLALSFSVFRLRVSLHAKKVCASWETGKEEGGCRVAHAQEKECLKKTLL